MILQTHFLREYFIANVTYEWANSFVNSDMYFKRLLLPVNETANMAHELRSSKNFILRVLRWFRIQLQIHDLESANVVEKYRCRLSNHSIHRNSNFATINEGKVEFQSCF